MGNFQITMKLNIHEMCGKTSVRTEPEGLDPVGLNINVSSDSISRVADAVLDYLYDEHSQFSGGFCRVKKGGLWGYVTPELKEFGSLKYSEASNVSEGYAIVRRDGKYSFLQMEGVAYPVQVPRDGTVFDSTGDIINGMAWVRIGDKYGFFSTKDKSVIIPCEYEDIISFSHDKIYTKVKKNGKWGLVCKDGKVLIEPVFDSLAVNDSGFEGVIGNVTYVGKDNGKYEPKQ